MLIAKRNKAIEAKHSTEVTLETPLILGARRQRENSGAVFQNFPFASLLISRQRMTDGEIYLGLSFFF